MKNYYFYLKSHCPAPDLEMDLEARDKNEAVDIVMRRYHMEDFPREIIEKSIEEENN
jgi:hypothetical protein